MLIGMRFWRRDAGIEMVLDEAGVSASASGKARSRVLWKDLVRIEIHVVTVGGLKLTWVLIDREGTRISIPFPNEPKGFLERVQMLPGFREDEFLASMQAKQGANFTCWTRLSHQ